MSDKINARAFFEQLTAFSQEVLKVWKLPDESPWGRGEWRTKSRGAILHYTASKSLESTARWFCDPRYDSKASSHIIVAQTKIPDLQSLENAYPALAELPVTVLQVRPWYKRASHATWANTNCFGIEMINAGVLSPQAGEWFNKRGTKVAPIQRPVLLHGRWWEPYPTAQVAAVIAMLRMYRFADTLYPGWVLGHESVQSAATGNSSHKDKRDPGPLFPINDVRTAAFADTPIADLKWRRMFEADAYYGRTWRDEVAIWYARAVGMPEDVPAGAAWDRLMDDSEERLHTDLRTLPEHPTLLDAALLQALGYWAVEGARWPPTLGIFQRMAGLPADEGWNPRARRELSRRVGDRGFMISDYDPQHLI